MSHSVSATHSFSATDDSLFSKAKLLPPRLSVLGYLGVCGIKIQHVGDWKMKYVRDRATEVVVSDRKYFQCMELVNCVWKWPFQSVVFQPYID